MIFFVFSAENIVFSPFAARRYGKSSNKKWGRGADCSSVPFLMVKATALTRPPC